MQAPIRGCGLTHPCGDGYGKGADYWLTLAYSGGCPGRFDVGCQVPMKFKFTIPAGAGAITSVTIFPKQPNTPVALIADTVSTAAEIDKIIGPDGKDIGMEGGGISGAPYQIAQFSFEALRSYVNLFPLNVGMIDSSDGLQFDVLGLAAATIFAGFAVGFVGGLKGVRAASTLGYLAANEVPYQSQLAAWQESGECSPALLARLENAVKKCAA